MVESFSKLKQNVAIFAIESTSINTTIIFWPVDHDLSYLLLCCHSDFCSLTVLKVATRTVAHQDVETESVATPKHSNHFVCIVRDCGMLEILNTMYLVRPAVRCESRV